MEDYGTRFMVKYGFKLVHIMYIVCSLHGIISWKYLQGNAPRMTQRLYFVANPSDLSLSLCLSCDGVLLLRNMEKPICEYDRFIDTYTLI